MGRNSYVHPSAQILGLNSVAIGENTYIGERVWLNVNHAHKDRFAIQIGSNCFIGRDNFFTSGEKILIGDYCLTTIGCKFIGSSHCADNPSMPYIMAGTTADDVIIVEDNCFFGAEVAVVGSVTIGRGSIIGSKSVVLKNIPPFSIAVGNPARVIRRYSFSARKWVDVGILKENDLLNNPDAAEYRNILKKMCPLISMPGGAIGADFGSI